VQNFVGVAISGDNSRMRTLVLDGLFSDWHFDREIVILCIRWYLRFKLSFRDLVEMMEERGHCHINQKSSRLNGH
jgi:transposase-like protein